MIRRNSDQNALPIATIEKLTLQGSYWGLLATPKLVRRVKAEGLRIFVSPGSECTGNEAGPAGSLEKFGPFTRTTKPLLGYRE